MARPLSTGLVAAVLLALTGCATVPAGPRVMVLPGSNKPFDVFQQDDRECRAWARQQIGPVEDRAAQQVGTGAVVGTLVGAGLGAALGAISGHPGAGAAIGGGTGLFLGSAAGANAAYETSWDAQRRYDNAYTQCMYAKGNQVPAYGQRGRAPAGPRYATPPPPPPPVAERGVPAPPGTIPPPPPGPPPPPPPGS
ncbi:MAG TPA: YMGG-like glycine zipper-containing protein [Vicinamibacteria bacterium]|nr:YMGG-like glycine zipper-containing protein [Vicinamibacteria bacterium]